MMDLDAFRSISAGELVVSAEQASAFAKEVAGDFNPLHDVGNKRFCVPGDLLFTALLDHYGVYANLEIEFEGMVGANSPLTLPGTLTDRLDLLDERGRLCLRMTVSGDRSSSDTFANKLALEYVRFSGKTFPDILVDLMRQHQVMINPTRPLVIYKDMSLTLARVDDTAQTLSLTLDKASLSVTDKKGLARLEFILLADGVEIGRGCKNMVLGGLRAFDEDAVAGIVDQYNSWRQDYRVALADD